MSRIFTAFISFICILSIQSPTYSETATPKQESGVFSKIGKSISNFFAHMANYTHNPDETDSLPGSENPVKTSAELIQKDAKVSEKLYLEFAGPRGTKEQKPSVDLDAVKNKIAPLPEAEKISPDQTKNSSIRKEMAKEAALENMENESQRIEEIDNKIMDSMPQAKLATTLSAEKAADAPHSMGALEADFSRGHPNKS
ncbi:MAG: hypothetical protein Q8S21_05640 [Candidatus Paracaedibacteraceae bacterium]|nr:hypothetical protein [Candidatus Paracaedibacteraceae bacterium]